MRAALIVALGLVAGCFAKGTFHDPGSDAGTDGSKSIDAAIDAPPDAAPPIGIAGVRMAADTTPGTVSIVVSDVVVTYLKPMTGTEAAGFFVQKQAAGPAVFIAVDPATLTPPAAVGDTVSFTVTTVAVSAGLREATAITSYSRSATGFDVSTLVTDVSSASDVVSALDAYESRLVRLTGTIGADFASAGGGGFQSAQINTAGLTSTSMKMRLPTTLQTSMDLVNTCTLTLTGPMWRFNAQAQPSGFVGSDLSVSSCPAPKVTSAAAGSLTSIVVTFDRTIKTSSVMSNASQFTFTSGLTASAAAVSGKTVTLTTSTQTVDQAYTLTVANTVTDIYGTGVDAAATTSDFTGYAQAAVVIINEINPNIGSKLDLIELKVIQTGTVKNMKFGQGLSSSSTLANLPAVTVTAGDYIVIHLGPTTATAETTGKGQCTDAACYPNAWDFVGSTTTNDLTYSHRVVWVKNPDNSLHDAVPFVQSATGSPPSAFPGDLQTIQAAGFWSPSDCGGALCTYTTTPTAVAVSADWATVGNTAAGKSLARTGTGKTASDWTILSASTFGAANQ